MFFNPISKKWCKMMSIIGPNASHYYSNPSIIPVQFLYYYLYHEGVMGYGIYTMTPEWYKVFIP